MVRSLHREGKWISRPTGMVLVVTGRGRYIALEGAEGCGKSTHAQRLADDLDAVLTRETGGTRIGGAIREILHDNANTDLSDKAEVLLIAADRAQHMAEVVRPALQAGRHVVSDRSAHSSLAYQGAAAGLGEDAIRALHSIGSNGLLPDVTLLLVADTNAIAARIEVRDSGVSDKIGGRSAEFHADVAAAFKRLAEAEPERFRRIEASGSIDAVHALVIDALRNLLP